MSFAKELMEGKPVVFTGKEVPNVICPKGKEKEALELMKDMGLITLTRMENENKG